MVNYGKTVARTVSPLTFNAQVLVIIIRMTSPTSPNFTKSTHVKVLFIIYDFSSIFVTLFVYILLLSKQLQLWS